MFEDNPNWVLVVDDNDRNLMVLQSILEKVSIPCKTSTSGKEALLLAMQSPPALVLLDIMMPEMDGITVCKKLKEIEHTRDIPVIFISALTSKEDVLQGFEAGGVDYITKPFHKEEVLARVKAHLTIIRQKRELQETNQKLKEAIATKDRLFSIISHDLIGPVVNINNVLNIAVNQPMEKELLIEFLRDALAANTSTLDLLKNLLAWAKNQRNEINFNPHNIDVSIIIDDNLNLLKGLWTEKKLTVINHIQSPMMCFADENMLTIIFRNLISNAIKYSYEGGKIEICCTETEQNKIKFCVIDEGTGIEPENLQRILNRYEHFTTLGTHYEKGHGLGLTLVQDFVTAHKGILEIETEPGRGSRFCFSIPKNLSDFPH
ncbi:MAG: two-component system, sensor histidine kinase and response regulator [Bacteroidales bacterium]|jgi:two-component system sensor histidine kinase/response regulator|nr:two-component system, sensor histidine kinase and response regulator [Bacteroidales bacterium]MDN5328395.1 two-component system, sensor histidine kinase and response regulator [Bacteroidales bacterium]